MTDHADTIRQENPMTVVRGLRRWFHRHRWIREFTDDAGIHETCGRCSKTRVRSFFWRTVEW